MKEIDLIPHQEKRKNRSRGLWVVIFIQSLMLMFLAGAVVERYAFVKQEPFDGDKITITLPRDERQLRKQFLINLAQGKILEQLMKEKDHLYAGDRSRRQH